MYSDFYSSDIIVASPVRLIGVSIYSFHLFFQIVPNQFFFFLISWIVPNHYPGDWSSYYLFILFTIRGAYTKCKFASLFCLMHST